MMFLVICALIGFAAAETGDTKTVGKFVYDLLKKPFEFVGDRHFLASKDAVYPRTASKTSHEPAFHATPKPKRDSTPTQKRMCQVFHRCDLNLNQTHQYLCEHDGLQSDHAGCDNWYNVDCGKSIDYENFGNSRLYTNLPLFDTPRRTTSPPTSWSSSKIRASPSRRRSPSPAANEPKMSPYQNLSLKASEDPHFDGSPRRFIGLRRVFEMECRGEITVKGKGLMTTYWLLHKTKLRPPPPLVGTSRKLPLATRQLWRKAAAAFLLPATL
ncbi:hypothetical protein BV898_06262 [Hypsibius exemplaris]|uniref:Guanylate cyclase domain-containing protein n=1 Tax=Hypsibius exemplaris TaxID=2072580 RepID=A0A1W0WX20_HYPEX|nr:hypothetical protein BV898_06262 [Hypsibius exemplaris]